MDLLLDKKQFIPDWIGILSENLARHVEIALYDGYRIVDFVSYPGRDLPYGRELFRHYELTSRGLEPFIGGCQLPRPLCDTTLEPACPRAQFAVAVLKTVQQLIQMLGHAPDLVGRAGGIDARVEIAPLHARDCRAHALERIKRCFEPTTAGLARRELPRA